MSVTNASDGGKHFFPDTPRNGGSDRRWTMSNHRVTPSGGTAGLTPSSTAAFTPRALPGEEGDELCGRKEYKFLSYTEARRQLDKTHPRRVVKFGIDGRVLETEKYKCCATSLGRHGCCGESQPSEWADYGTGVALYFKLLKFLAILFCFMSILLVPVMILFFNGGALENQVVTETDHIALLSLGNLGEGTMICESGFEGSRVELTCPEGSVIGEVNALYGNPQGSCECPGPRQPSPNCPGTVDGNGCAQVGGTMEEVERNRYCHLADSRRVRLPDGGEFFAGSCCADRLVDGQPAFPDLDIRGDPQCSAPAAAHVARGRCLGTGSCMVVVAKDLNQTWTPRESLNTECGPFVAPNQGNNPEQCSLSLGGLGGLDSCELWTGDQIREVHGDDSERMDFPNEEGRRRFLVVAQCFDIDIDLFDGWTVMSKREVAIFVVLVDVLMLIIFLCSTTWLHNREVAISEGSMLSGETRRFTAANYTIVVENLPDHVPPKDLDDAIRSHFESMLGREMPVRHVLSEVRVADVNFGLNQANMIQLFITRGKLLQKIDRVLKQMQIEQDVHGSERGIARLERKHEKLVFQLNRHDEHIDAVQARQASKKAINAYVTFEQEEARLRALHAYPNSTLYWLCQSREKRLFGKRLSVEEAPAPSDIIWENLEVSRTSRCVRQTITFFITVTALLVSGMCVFLMEDAKREQQRMFPSVDCSTISNATDKALAVEDEFWQFFNRSQGRTGRLDCYCRDNLNILNPSSALNEEFEVPGRDPATGEIVLGMETERLCRSWFESFVATQALTYGGAVIILFINFVLRFFLKMTVHFERIESRTSELVSRALKLFVLQFLNTAALVLLVNAQIDSSFVVFRRGQHRDFTEEWYRSVGVAIVITMVLNIVVPHATPIAAATLRGLRLCWDRSCSCDHTLTKSLTQAELNKKLVGPAFLVDERYAQMFNILFVCLLYSLGMPLMIPIAMLSFTLCYWLDKWFFISLYRTPPAYQTELAVRFSSLFPIAAIFHMLLGMWMISNEDIIPPQDVVEESSSLVTAVDGESGGGFLSSLTSWGPNTLNAAQRMSLPQSLPLLLLVLATVIYLILSRFLLLNLKRAFFAVCPCFHDCLDDDEDDAAGSSKFNIGGNQWRHRQLPRYWDAIPTDALRDVHEGRVAIKPRLRPFYEEAYQRRREAIENRERAMEEYYRMLDEMEERHQRATSLHQRSQSTAGEVTQLTQEEERLQQEVNRVRRAREAMRAAEMAQAAAERQQRRMEEKRRLQRLRQEEAEREKKEKAEKKKKEKERKKKEKQEAKQRKKDDKKKTTPKRERKLSETRDPGALLPGVVAGEGSAASGGGGGGGGGDNDDAIKAGSYRSADEDEEAHKDAESSEEEEEVEATGIASSGEEDESASGAGGSSDDASGSSDSEGDGEGGGGDGDGDEDGDDGESGDEDGSDEEEPLPEEQRLEATRERRRRMSMDMESTATTAVNLTNEAERLRQEATQLYFEAGLNLALEAPKTAQVLAQFMSGLHSYDMHDSHEYATKFGEHTDAAKQYPRRIQVSLGDDMKREAEKVEDGDVVYDDGMVRDGTFMDPTRIASSMSGALSAYPSGSEAHRAANQPSPAWEAQHDVDAAGMEDAVGYEEP